MSSTSSSSRKNSHQKVDLIHQTLTKHKKIAFTAIEQQVIELQNVGETIWRLKEEPGNEEKSMKFVCAFLIKKGFKVQEKYMGFTGAFRAEYGEGEQGGAKNPNICFLCQYDATPSRANDTDECRKSTQTSTEMSHSMGHNLVTVNALTAALGLQCVIKFATEPMGKVTVIGCASNKEGTGKVAMMDQSCFKGVDFILTAYPSHYTNVSPIFTGSKTYSVQYKGKPDSAKSQPWEITNPVNAVTMAYQNVSAARGKFLPDWKATSVITSAGESADRIPRQACMEWLVQAPRPEEMKQLDTKLQQCLQAAATAPPRAVTWRSRPASRSSCATCRATDSRTSTSPTGNSTASPSTTSRTTWRALTTSPT